MNNVEFFTLKGNAALKLFGTGDTEVICETSTLPGRIPAGTECALGESSDVKSPKVLICLAQTVVMLQVLLSLLPKLLAGSVCSNGADSSP